MKVSSILGDLGNKFLHDKQPRTGSDVKTKIAEAYSNFQVPTTSLENDFQLKKLNSCISEYDTQKILNRLRIINKKEILLPLKEHCAHFSYKETIISWEECTSPSITKSWGSKGENADPRDDTTLSNRSKGENADLYDDIINLSNNEKVRSFQNFLRKKLKYFVVQPEEVFPKCLSLLPNSNYEFFSKSYLIPIYYKDKVNIEINKWLEFGIMKRRIVDKKDGYYQKSINANKINDLKSYPSIEKMITECNDTFNFEVRQ